MSERFECPNCLGNQRFEAELWCRSCSRKAANRRTIGVVAMIIGPLLMTGGLLFFGITLFIGDSPLWMYIFPWPQIVLGLAILLYGVFSFRRNRYNPYAQAAPKEHETQ